MPDPLPGTCQIMCKGVVWGQTSWTLDPKYFPHKWSDLIPTSYLQCKQQPRIYKPLILLNHTRIFWPSPPNYSLCGTTLGLCNTGHLLIATNVLCNPVTAPWPRPFPRPGVEGICAGMFLPAIPCLVHGKVLKTHLDVWVKTSSNLLTNSIAKVAQSEFEDW